MESLPELPLHLFLSQSLSFCNTLKSDLDEFINQVKSEFSSIDCNVKIAPKVHQKGRRGVDTADSCVLDLKEFVRSKENVLHNVKSDFESMEMKWANELAALKEWFLTTVETSLSRIQLEIKVTAEDLNLSKPACEMDIVEDSSSESEVEMVPSTYTHVESSNRSAKKRRTEALTRKSVGTTRSKRRIIVPEDSPQSSSSSCPLSYSSIAGRAQGRTGSKAPQFCQTDEGNDGQFFSSFSGDNEIAQNKRRSRVQTRKSVGFSASTEKSAVLDDSDAFYTSAADQSMYQDDDNLSNVVRPTVKSRARGSTKKVAKGTKRQMTQDEKTGHSVVTTQGLKGKMADWRSLLSAVESAPCKPGVYEIKVSRAKNPAYIGHSDDLQNTFSVYIEGKPSGERHLDLFIQRNKEEVTVRYEELPSSQLAKIEQKKKLLDFREKHKNLPSYNYGV